MLIMRISIKNHAYLKLFFELFRVKFACLLGRLELHGAPIAPRVGRVLPDF